MLQILGEYQVKMSIEDIGIWCLIMENNQFLLLEIWITVQFIECTSNWHHWKQYTYTLPAAECNSLVW